MMFINPIPFIPFPLIRGRGRAISREASLARGDSVDLSLTPSQRRGEKHLQFGLNPPIISLSGRSAAWLARSVRDAEVGGSNPPAPIFTVTYSSLPETVHVLAFYLLLLHQFSTQYLDSPHPSTFFASSHRAFCSSKDSPLKLAPRWRQTSSI